MPKVRSLQLNLDNNYFRSLWVNKATAIPTNQQDGSAQRPYQTIQQAINAVPAATTAAEMRLGPWQIRVASGTYDEDLTVNYEDRSIFFIAYGIVNLGTFDTDGWLPSGTRRNITFTGFASAKAGLGLVAPIVAFLSADKFSSSRISSYKSWNISGKLDFTAVTSTTNFRFSILDTRIYGTDGTVTGQSIVANPVFGASNDMLFFCEGLSLTGTFTGNCSFQGSSCKSSTFTGEVSIRRMFGPVYDTLFAENVTLNSGGVLTGLFACFFGNNKTWTATAAINMDAVTFQQAKTTNLTLAGAGTVYSLIATANETRLSFGGTLALALDTATYQGPANSAALVALGPLAEGTCESAMNLTKFSWNSAAATAATTMQIFKNGVLFVTVTLTGAKGSVATLVSVAAGDLIAVKWSGAGVAPGLMTCSLST